MAERAYADMERALDALRPAIAGMSQEEAEAAIVALVTGWAGSPAAAHAWLTAELPAFGLSPHAMIEAGRAGHLLDEIERLGDGGYA